MFGKGSSIGSKEILKLSKSYKLLEFRVDVDMSAYVKSCVHEKMQSSFP